jgi:serine protease Do/2-alkenal reductase
MPQLSDLVAKVMPAVVSIASTDPVPDNAPGDTGAGSTGAGSGNNGTNGDNGSGDGGSGGGKGNANAAGGKEHAGAPQNSADAGAAGAPEAGAAETGTVLPPPKADEALGSGFVFDPAGYILTNNHVIAGAASITVTFQDGTILPAIIVGRDKDADLAVLKVDAGHQLPFVRFGDSGKLRVGDWVVAIGNPFGLPGSTSAGIVSALNRNIGQDKYDDFIQTDAAINRGNSGGPLFDMQGQVIGVDSAIYSPSGGSIGLGFAIPAAMAGPVAEALVHSGSMTRGWLGISTEEVTPGVQHVLGLPDTAGALVGAVAGDSPAAGKLAPGDVVTGLDNVPIKTPRALFIRTAEIPAGTEVPVQFWRDGAVQQTSLRVTVPPKAENDTIKPIPPKPPGNLDLAGLGLSVSEQPVADGVKVVSVTGPSAKAGIVAGDIIEAAAGQNVASAAALQAQVQALAKTLPVAVLLVAGDTADGTNPGPRWLPVMFQTKK